MPDLPEDHATVVAFPQARLPDGDRWEPWVDETALARHLGVSTRTLRRWRAAGMPSQRMRGSRRYKVSQAEHWLRLQEAS